MSIFNNPDFYPTPESVIDSMLFDHTIKGRVILEPSAGSGAILDYCIKRDAKELLCCENDPDLARIASTKGRLIASDFLTVTSEQVSHIDMIVMNPPFSADEKHIIHAWNVAPAGCEIIALCNWQTYANDHTRMRESLKQIITKNGHCTNLGDAFSDAERKTGVNIGLIKLFKPKGEGENEFDGYFDMFEDHEQQEDGVMGYNEIRSLVNRYTGAVRMFNEVIAMNEKMTELINPISVPGMDIRFGAFNKQSIYQTITRDTFKKELQKSAWKAVFEKLEMQKYVTGKVMENINKFVEKQTNVPFTMSNIAKMVQMIVGTHGDRMNRVVVEVFDKLTEHYHENRYCNEGWKTNSEYIVNRKCILPAHGLFRMAYTNGFADAGHLYNGGSYITDDLTKAICYITGEKYDTMQQWWKFMQNQQEEEISRKYPHPKKPNELVEYTSKELRSLHREYGVWHEFNHFRLKMFKKGTLHLEFKDEKVWIKFNQTAAKAKGFQLASKFTGDFRAKKQGVEVY